MNTYSSTLFSYKNKRFVAERSDFICFGDPLAMLDYSAEWTDGEPIRGFDMISIRTGRRATFFLAETNFDREHDIVDWVLKPTSESIASFPQLEGVQVILIND